MSRERYVLLGLGRTRSPWFGNVALWTTSGAVPAEFHKCLSTLDVRQRLNGLQPHSALLVEAGMADVDRDLLETARRMQTPAFVIADAEQAESWLELGATAVLAPDFTPTTLLQTLAANTRIISSARIDDTATVVEPGNEQQGQLLAICGPGGTGASTVAIALAQAMATEVTQTDHVLLADFTRNSEQAMLHDAADVTPSVEELIELHRHRHGTADNIRELTFGVEQRGYRLLLGQRRVGAWAAMPPSAVATAIRGLRRTFRAVVADLTADFEGEHESGSLDVEERNALARLTVAQADFVLVVGTPGFKGIHALTHTMRHVVNAGTEPERVLPVVVRSSKRSLERAEISKTISTLGQHGRPPMAWNTPLFLPDRCTESVLRDGRRLPKELTTPLGSAVDALYCAMQSKRVTDVAAAELVAPGSLGGA